MFNLENRWVHRNTKPPNCPVGEVNKGLILPAEVWEDTPEEGTLQLDLEG